MEQYGGTSGKWYTISPTKHNFDDAVTYCTDLGLPLATVTTVTDLDNVISYMSKSLYLWHWVVP